MTRNQIEYAKLLEQRRANVAQEENARAKIRYDYSLGMFNAQEAQRHNAQTEGANVRSLDEVARHNRMQENVSLIQAAENERYHTLQVENLRQQLSEQIRSNQARERETARSNLAAERELNRYHTASLGEQVRANVARESLGSAELAEQVRYHNLYFDAESARLAETERSNVAKESETHRSNYAAETETERSHMKSEEIRIQELNEEKRHNIVTEIEKGVSTVTSSGKDAATTINNFQSNSGGVENSNSNKRVGAFGGSRSTKQGSGRELVPSVPSSTGGNWSITLGGGYSYYGS